MNAYSSALFPLFHSLSYNAPFWIDSLLSVDKGGILLVNAKRVHSTPAVPLHGKMDDFV